MENKVLKLGGGRSTKDVYAEISQGNSERWTIQSQKRKYVNGKLSGVIEVGYSAGINTPDYVLEEDKSNNSIFRLLHKMTVLLGFVYLHKMNLVIK